MKKLLLSILFATTVFGAQAQGYIDQITRKKAGEGTVTVVQDQRLSNIINALAPQTLVTEEHSGDEFSMQVVRRKKVRGYRVQMFWGNAQRSDQQRAQRIGNQVTAVFPELQAYTSFESPHWRCRVGDFVTREEAAKYLPKLRRISSDAMIVRSEIFILQ